MSLTRCDTCGRHVRLLDVTCPFCSSRVRAPGKSAVAALAGVAAMGVGLGCAYGMPSDYGVRDSGTKPDVQVGDASVVDASKDAPEDAPTESGVEAGIVDAGDSG